MDRWKDNQDNWHDMIKEEMKKEGEVRYSSNGCEVYGTLMNNMDVNIEEDGTEYNGKIVGLHSNGHDQIYIIECTDNKFPNKNYRYKIRTASLSNINI